MVVHFSKNHNARIDNQVAEDKVVADVVHLQTIDDFPRSKREGVLEQYRPVGWDRVYDQVKDSDGYYTGVFFFAFSNVTATELGTNAPVASPLVACQPLAQLTSGAADGPVAVKPNASRL